VKEPKPNFLIPKISPLIFPHYQISYRIQSNLIFKRFNLYSTVSKVQNRYSHLLHFSFKINFCVSIDFGSVVKMDHLSFNIGISQIITPNNDQIFYSEDSNWAEQRSKSLHDPALMANQSSTKRKSKKEVEASSKAKNAKTQKKRDRKVAPPISRPTLPMVCISFAFNLDIVEK